MKVDLQYRWMTAYFTPLFQSYRRTSSVWNSSRVQDWTIWNVIGDSWTDLCPVSLTRARHCIMKMEAMLVCSSMEKGCIFWYGHGPWICKKWGVSESQPPWILKKGVFSTTVYLWYLTISVEQIFLRLIWRWLPTWLIKSVTEMSNIWKETSERLTSWKLLHVSLK